MNINNTHADGEAEAAKEEANIAAIGKKAVKDTNAVLEAHGMKHPDIANLEKAREVERQLNGSTSVPSNPLKPKSVRRKRGSAIRDFLASTATTDPEDFGAEAGRTAFSNPTKPTLPEDEVPFDEEEKSVLSSAEEAHARTRALFEVV